MSSCIWDLGFFAGRCTGESLPLRVDFIHRVEFGEVSGHQLPIKRDREIGVLRNVEAPTRPRLECRRETGLILRCDRKTGTRSRQSRGVDPPVEIRRVEGAQSKWCRKTSVFLSRETGMSGNILGRIKGAKYRFDLQFLTWDFS